MCIQFEHLEKLRTLGAGCSALLLSAFTPVADSGLLLLRPIGIHATHGERKYGGNGTVRASVAQS